MLEDINIKDFALIDAVALDFGAGLTVLSGETGAGKSILIGAISFLLGGRGGSELIRTGAAEARVSGTINLAHSPNKDIGLWLSERSIEPENGRLLLRRLVRDNGKTAAWIQDTPVTRNELAEFTSWCIDIHGQHEHQSLIRVSEHRRFLDSYAGIEAEVARFTELYALLVEKRKILADMNLSDSRRSEKMELLSFAVQEIEDARLREGEDTSLSQEEIRLSQYEKLYQELKSIFAILSGEEGGNLLLSLKKARTNLEHASNIDKTLAPLSKRIDTLFYELSDITEEISSYVQSLVFDPARFEEVQERLALIFKLKKKYCASSQSPLAELIVYAEKARQQLEQMDAGEENRKALETEISALERTVYKKASELSIKRQAAAQKMALDVEKVLIQLGMKGTCFQVKIQQKEAVSDDQKCGPYGIDDIEFLIAPNLGVPARSLIKIASGGELSRIMLALKTVLNNSDSMETLIFDEIDTGIGGEVALSVGRHLKQLAAQRQILCITHLASIAVFADTQIKIEKTLKAGSTSTQAFTVKENSRVEEIARMLSGDAVSPASLEHARSLLNKYRSI